MSKRKIVVAAVALTACLCWAFASTIAEPQNQTPGTGPVGSTVESEGVDVSIVGYVPSMDMNAPSDSHVPVRLADSERVKPCPSLSMSETPEEQALRLGIPCLNIAYENGPSSGNFVYIFGGIPPNDNMVDDLILPPDSPNKFVCAAQVITSTYQPYGGPPFYNLRVQAWSDCPENPGAVLLGQGDFLSIPNDGDNKVSTITIDPPYKDVDDTIWVLCRSEHVAADIVITNNTTDAGDIGNTANLFALLNGIGDCSDNLFAFGAPTYAGFWMILLGSSGPPGSCCDLNTGLCTDGVLQSACADFLTQSWSIDPCSLVGCVACTIPTCLPLNTPPNLENEPDCTTNYVDTVNRGCNNLTSRAYTYTFTPLNCAQSGCGRSGTYTFLNTFTIGGTPTSLTENRRDADHYRLDLTQDTRVTWTVSGKFPSQAVISYTLKQTNNVTSPPGLPSVTGPILCPVRVIEQEDGVTTAFDDITAGHGANSIGQANACQDAVATAVLEGRNELLGGNPNPYRYMLQARPAVTKLTDNALCGLPYTVNLVCEPATAFPTGACCVEAGCITTTAMGCLLTTGVHSFYQGDGTICPSVCTGVPANDLCPNAIVLTCTSCTIPYDTTFAKGEGQSLGPAGVVAKDLWFDYTVPQPGGCATGRVVASTLYSCFNSKLQFIKLSNCNTTAATKCQSNNWTNRGAVNITILEAGPPIVNVGPWVYGRGTQNPVPGECWKIRVGGVTEDDFGVGILRIGFVCSAPQAGFGWANESGRCCFPNGDCMELPLGTSTNGPTCCATMGGYLRNATDFFEGSGAGVQGVTEVQGVTCASLPCPPMGEACFNAWDLNSLFGGGFGTVTRLTRNKTYFKYTVPSVAAGTGIVLSACGSEGDPARPGFIGFDTAMAVYRGFNLTTGECHNLDTSALGPGLQACTGTAYNNAEIARVNDCGESDVFSSGAQGRVSCYGSGENFGDGCLCLTVVTGTPGDGQVKVGDVIYIGMGIKNDLSGSPRPFTDPVRSDSCTTFDRMFSLQVTNPASCFTCTLACPGINTPEGENLSGCPDTLVDTYNAGCNALSVLDINFLPITCGETYCASSATYRFNKLCLVNADCGLGDQCVTGTCQGPDDNAKDYDYYRIQITTPQRLTWTVNAVFPATLQILESPDDNCQTAVALATSVNAGQCNTTVASADVCPGYIYLTVRPTNDVGTACGSLYYGTLTCGASSIAANACCKADMNNDGLLNGKDIRPFVDQILPIPAGSPASVLNPVRGCFDVSTCRADMNLDYLVNLTDVAGFVSALLGGVSCPATICGDSGACHLPVGDDSGVVSDLSVSNFGGGFRIADDFKIASSGASQVLNKLCWFGFYFNFNTLAACTNPMGDMGDDFKITIYADSGGLPGNAIANANAVSPINLVKTNTAQTLTYLSKTVTRIKYECDLPAGITVSNGSCYWLEIVDKTSGACLWLWETSANSGNGVSLQQPGGFPAGTSNFYSFNLAPEDFSFCLPGLRISNIDCGLPLGRCCIYPPGNANGSCSVQNRPTCEVILAQGGNTARWVSGADCSQSCPLLPLNDNCADAILVTSGPIYTGSTIVATTDGPSMSCEASCGGLCNRAPDVWYKWVAVFDGASTFTMCDTIDADPGNYPPLVYSYDAMMLVYDNCPSLFGQQMPGGCNDDGCGLVSAATNSRITSVTVVAGTTYWVRISGWQGNVGNFTFRVNQP